eukprot:TRINITY_DN4251_c0_g1_i1.p2 TRINITY_DN4251_c0_g1~~TRINITY_DN4251_c0_g1_i1.p2  ORF type:complete len:429 (+),score=146.28 TRINITY_DN4251_c0_g1_i1:119-1405(+)
MQLDVGTDLYGTKHNTTLVFPSLPGVAELTAATESYFDTKARACRPAGYPDVPFKIETFQLFDDTLLRWVDLYDAQQLRPGQQLWCFQPESIWHSDAQGVIPQAERAPVTWTTPAESPRRRRQTTDAGVPPTLSEKLRSVFYQCDAGGKGYLLYADLETAFRKCEMEFTHGTAGELFQLADANRSGHITYDEWVSFAIRCPQVVDALFFRMRDMWQDQGVPAGAPHPSPDAQRSRQEQLRGYYQEQWASQERDRQQLEYDAARAAQREQEAQQQAQEAARRQAEAQAQAQRAQAELAAAEDAARQAAAQQAAHAAAAQQAAAEHQRALQAAQAAAAYNRQVAQQEEEARAAAPSSGYGAPYQQSYAPSPSPPHGGASPPREQALRDYEAAKRRADQLRAQKDEAERMERDAWNQLYYCPQSPHYGPGS